MLIFNLSLVFCLFPKKKHISGDEYKLKILQVLVH